MTDYSQYKYNNLLSFLDETYENSTDKTNYATVLLEMQNATSINECLSIYDKVYSKYTKLYCPRDFDEDLSCCLNDNLIRLMKSSYPVSAEEALANLRPCSNLDEYQKKIVSYGRFHTEQSPLDFENDANKIIKATQTYIEACEKIKGQTEGTNGWKNSQEQIMESLAILKANGYVKCKTDFAERHIEDWVFYIIAIMLVIVLVYCFGGLLLLILPLLGLRVMLKGGL